MKKTDTVRTYKDNGTNPPAVAFCQVYKEYETSIPEPNNVNQDERTRLNEVRAPSENTSDIKLDLVEYINECSKEQQQILSTDIHKNHKLLAVPIKRKKDTIAESHLITLEKKESYQQLETSTIELTKFRSNTNEGIFLSINEELQLDTSFTQGNLKENVNTSNTKDKGKKLQKQILQKEKCMKKKDNVCTCKDIGKHPHDVASCQIYDKKCKNKYS